MQLRSADNKTVQETGYQPLRIDGPNAGTGEPITLTGLKDDYYRGDLVRVTVAHRGLKDGEQGRWRYRSLPGTAAWNEPPADAQPQSPAPGTYLLDTSWLNFTEWSYEIVDAAGAVVGRSPAFAPEIGNRELLLSGVRPVYRPGDTLEAASELYPARDDVAYEWGMVIGEEYSKLPGANAATVSLPVTAELDGALLYLDTYDATTRHHIASTNKQLRVTDAAPGERMLFIDSLSEHYHQGNTIKLTASADPVAGATDTYRWFLQRADWDAFRPLEGITTASHELRAEQALDGAQIKVELRTAAGELVVTSEPATVHVDDHGAAPQQKVAVEGLADHYHTGDAIELAATVAPASVLTRWEWHVQRAGQTAPEIIEGRTLTLTAAAALEGATVVARLTFDDGRAYVSSSPVTLHIDDHGDGGGDNGGGDNGGGGGGDGSGAAKTITAEISEAEGALVISVAAADRDVVLPAAALNSSGDRWESTGTLKPVTVTDTRVAQPGWTASGQVAEGFRGPDGATFPGSHLGWTPTVVEQASQQGVAAGPVTAPDTSGKPGAGLGGSAVLATAPDGAGRGTARLDAGLQLSLPTDTATGTYTGVLTLTAI